MESDVQALMDAAEETIDDLSAERDTLRNRVEELESEDPIVIPEGRWALIESVDQLAGGRLTVCTGPVAQSYLRGCQILIVTEDPAVIRGRLREETSRIRDAENTGGRTRAQGDSDE